MGRRAESWRPVPDWPYEVSDRGRVRRSEPARGTRVGYVLAPWLGGDPSKGTRFYVTFSRRGERADPKVAKLVAETFLGPPPFPDAEIDHIDGDRYNDAAENLEWVTPAENQRRRVLRDAGEWPPAPEPAGVAREAGDLF